jgi:hypothetical protein
MSRRVLAGLFCAFIGCSVETTVDPSDVSSLAGTQTPEISTSSKPSFRPVELLVSSTAAAIPVPGNYVGTCTAGGSCSGSEFCPFGQNCANGTCTGGTFCYSDSQCGTAQTCETGTCSVSGTGCRFSKPDASNAHGCPTGERCNKFMDMAVMDTTTGTWYIDAGANGYDTNINDPSTRWDFAYSGYGSNVMPCPADYDGDGLTDLSVKDQNGVWYIDYSSDGFGAWDVSYPFYGGSSAICVPADYDGDGLADLSVKDSTGFWGIDYASAASGGYGQWNLELTGYGDATNIPVPADYDGDGKADLAIKDQSNGEYFIDFSKDGIGHTTKRIVNGKIVTVFSMWNLQLAGYGTATPIPYDYDGDGMADIGEKDASGAWYIDDAVDGFGSWNHEIFNNYGGTYVGTPGDYDHDGLVDLSAADPTTGKWLVDYQRDGWNGWNLWPTGFATIDNVGRQFFNATAPYIAATTITGPDNLPTNTLIIGRRYTVDVTIQPAAGDNNTSCSGVKDWTGCLKPNGRNGECLAGACTTVASAEVNTALNIPSALHIADSDGGTYEGIRNIPCNTSSDCPPDINVVGPAVNACNSSTHLCDTHRRFAVECSSVGNYPIGFQLRNSACFPNRTTQPGTVACDPGGTHMPNASVMNPDYGIRVMCTSETLANGTQKSGIYGTVTHRVQDANGVFTTGTAIGGATISIVGTGVSATSAADGTWSLATTGGPYTIRVSGPNCPGPSCAESDAVAVNVTVPESIYGLELDTPLEEAFTPLAPLGMTIFHVVEADKASSSNVVKVGMTPLFDTIECDACGTGCKQHIPLTSAASSLGAAVMTNGIWVDGCDITQGYAYQTWYDGQTGYNQSEVWCDDGNGSTTNCSDSNLYYSEGAGSGDGGLCTNDASHGTDGLSCSLYGSGVSPMFTVNGLGTTQTLNIVSADDYFFETTGGEWSQVPFPVWDPAGSRVSNVDYAIQIPNPPLLVNGSVIGGGDFFYMKSGGYDNAIARTSIGIDSVNNKFFLVVCDGEGVMGGNGCTENQLAHLYRDSLGATAAMGLDSGLSTEMVLQDAAGWRHVNTITGEDGTIQVNPNRQSFAEVSGAEGSVSTYVGVGPASLGQ